jgi:hypothetical protein
MSLTINRLSNPNAGSANPSASLSSLWGYLQPAVDHLIRSPTNDEFKAASIDVEYHMGIHTATYNYFTSQSESTPTTTTNGTTGSDLYQQLDIYFAGAARDLFLAAPQDDSSLIHYIVPCFNRFSAGSHSVNRLLNYVNRHYVKRAVDEDKGWLRITDVLESITKSDDSRDKISKRLRERRFHELKKWGYHEDPSGDLAISAEACAEAASPPDRVVPVSSLALRRFRTEFFEPLLAVPKLGKKSKLKNRLSNQTSPGPKGRLARAVKQMLESNGVDEEERTRLISQLATALKSVGIRGDHPLRRKLDKFVAALPS